MKEDVVEKVQCLNCIHLDYDTFGQPFCDLDNMDMDPEEFRICRQFYPYPTGARRKNIPTKIKDIRIIRSENSTPKPVPQKLVPQPKPPKQQQKIQKEQVLQKQKTPKHKIIKERRRKELEKDLDNTIKAGELHVKLYKKEIDVDTFKNEMKKLNFCDKDIEESIVEVIKVWGVVLE